MKRVLGLFVLAYWSAFFGVLAFAALTGVGGGTGFAFEAWQIESWPSTMSPLQSTVVATVLAFGYSLCGVLFIWTLIATLFGNPIDDGDTDEIARLAFAVAIGLATVLMIAGTVYGGSGPFFASSVQVVALLVSYVAIRAEGSLPIAAREDEDDGIGAARMMALGAAHSSMLSKLSGRPDGGTRGL